MTENKPNNAKKGATAARLVSRGNAAHAWGFLALQRNLDDFNAYALPVLKELGGLEKDFTKNLDLSDARLYELFLKKALSEAKNEQERKQAEFTAPAKFAEYIARKREVLDRVRPQYTPKALACIFFNERWQAFSVNQEEFLKDSYIMAETPRELKALETLEAVRDALNAFDWRRLQFRQVFAQEFGKFTIADYMARGIWEDLLNGFKG